MKRFTPQTLILYAAALASLIIVVGHAASCRNIPTEGFIFNDFSVMKYFMGAAREFHAETGRLWGYDPHFMAGFPLGFIWNSNIALQRIAVTFSEYSIDFLVKAVFIGGILAFPVMWWITLRTLGLNRAESAGGMVIGALYFFAGLPMMFFCTGMMTAGAVVYFALPAAAFVYRYMKSGGLWLVGVAVFNAAALYVHKTSAVALLPVWCVAAVICLRKKDIKKLVGLCAAAVIAVALNWEWISVVIEYRGAMQPVAEAPFWRNTDILLPLKEYFTGVVQMNTLRIDGVRGIVHSIVLTSIMGLAILGALKWKRDGAGERVAVILLPAAILWLFSYYGAFVPALGELNPTRYLSIVNMMLAVAAGSALSGMVSESKSRALINSLMGLIIVAAAVAGLAYLSQWYRPVNIMLAMTPSPETNAIVEKISELPEGGRIMIEDSGTMDTESAGQFYGSAHVVSNFGLWTGREFIGGPYPYVFLKYHYASFQDSRAFGSMVSGITPDEMLRTLELYNVKWIICWSDASKHYFERYSGYYSVKDEIGPFTIFDVSGYEPTFLVKGSADVSAKFGRIDAKNVVPEDGVVILKYHWPGKFRTEPKLEIEEEMIGNDPVGFIKVTNPPEEFTILIP